jgi:hypothetical protein
LWFFCRAKVFRGRKVHGEFDIKVEQVGGLMNLVSLFRDLAH